MNRLEFIVATSIILFVAFGLGWFSYWILHRFSRIGAADMNEVDRLAQALHEAEETRDQAILYLEQREAELMEQAGQTEAELRATSDSLKDARREVDDLTSYIARIKAKT